MERLRHILETLYFKALVDNAKTAQFKKRSYDGIERIYERIKDSEDPKKEMDNYKLSKGQREKLEEYVSTGDITGARQLEADVKVVGLRSLLGVYGIGPAKALKLIDAGICDIKQLQEALKKDDKLLNKSQKLGVLLYDDLKKRIPRKEIDSMRVWLEKNAPSSLVWRIVGSYRRGAKTSGDVDILVTGDGREALLRQLKDEGIIKHTLAAGKKKFMGIAVLPRGSVHRHLDVIETGRTEFPFTSLYFTGSADWNVKMRHRANEKGVRLNEHNFTWMKTGKELTAEDYKGFIGKEYPETEQDVCAVIDWEWKEPQERV